MLCNLVSISPSYSTTRLCFKLLDERYLGDGGRVKEEFKFNISFPELKIKNSTLIGKPEDKFETILFLPEGENRKGEGGLRTKGYFKFSYKKIDDEWYIIDDEDKPLQKVLLPAEVVLNQSIEYLPLVTIITVVYNSEKYLEDTIKSVINQTYPNIEYIIIDGGSTDGTLDIIKKYDDCIDYWVSEKDSGIYDAMNKGIDVARGKWVNFMNAGDRFFDKEVLDDIISIISKSISKNMISKNMIYGNCILTPSGKIQIQREWHFDYNKRIVHQTVFMPLDFVKQNKFDTDFKIMADYDLIRRFIHFNKQKVIYVNRIICYYDTSGISSQPLYKYWKEHLRSASKFGLLIYIKAFLHLIPRVIFSYFRNKMIKKER